jgi:hypothetical protein
MRRCEDERMFYRPPLLEEPCAQTLSGIKILKVSGYQKLSFINFHPILRPVIYEFMKVDNT